MVKSPFISIIWGIIDPTILTVLLKIKKKNVRSDKFHFKIWSASAPVERNLIGGHVGKQQLWAPQKINTELQSRYKMQQNFHSDPDPIP